MVVMKKISKFHNNNNNSTIYSLNYKFDSVSAAGKFSGTALDLIKKYNELAKEAHSNGNYVEMEVFRQYAEHYRKIVTEINERKNQVRENSFVAKENNANTEVENQPNEADNGLVETEAAPQTQIAEGEEIEKKTRPQRQVQKRRNFTVVTVADNATSEDTGNTDENDDSNTTAAKENAKPRRRTLTRKPRAHKVNEEQASAD